MKRWPFSGLVIGAAILWTWLAQDEVPYVNAPHLEMSFDFQPSQSRQEHSFTMPQDGAVCMIEDLNHRNGSVPEKAYPFADNIEGTNSILVIASSGSLAMTIDVPSTLPAPTREWVFANTQCENRRAGDEVKVRMDYNAVNTRWSLSLY